MPEEHLQSIDAFINLAGTSLNEGRWTDKRKRTFTTVASLLQKKFYVLLKHLM